MLFFPLVTVIFSVSFVAAADINHTPYLNDQDTDLYLAEFASLIKDSYSEPLPGDLVGQCLGKSPIDSSTVTLPVTLPENSLLSASQAQTLCGPNTACVLPSTSTLTMDANLNVGSLVVRGRLRWSDSATDQKSTGLWWLCAGFVVAESAGIIDINVVSAKAILYLKNNGASHPNLGRRSFGGIGTGQPSPKISVVGRELRRTWSLLAKPVINSGETSILLMHNAVQMGWRVGDRIAIASTARESQGESETFRIVAIAGNRIDLSSPTRQPFNADFVASNPGIATPTALLSAEVINLSRSVLITGDDFANIPCASLANPAVATTCTEGLHTAIMNGGEMMVKYARIEKCGQRGVKGKYCLHFHMLGACPSCVFQGNAIEFGQQRGIVVHGTHLSTVTENVIYDVRGAYLYVEDGNEMFNHISYNVAICPWPLWTGGKRGCTIPGTDNDQADTSANQAGLWALSQTNNVIGNRFAGHFNGMLYQANAFGGFGRAAAQGKCCTQSSPFGRMEGNTFHGHGRFGSYVLGDAFPQRIETSVQSNGFVADRSQCKAFTNPLGEDNGWPMVMLNNVDYGNAFVGGYDFGDIQFGGHVSLDNSNLIYWKTTKPFADGCAAHLRNAVYRNGYMALPDLGGAFIIENTRFEGSIMMESNHHCGVGTTGILCMPVYILDRVTEVNSGMQYQFHPEANNNGGIFTLAPPEQNNPDGKIFPPGFSSLVSSFYSTYLLSSGCVRSSDLGLGKKYSDGILCKRTLRPLRIYSRGLTRGTAQQLSVQVWLAGVWKASFKVPYHQIGADRETRKQGYAFPVFTGRDVKYRIELNDGSPIPTDWIVEFSDPVIGNRWAADEIGLEIKGRSCPPIVTSQHDRRFVYGTSLEHLTDSSFGHGACTSFPDMPSVACSKVPLLSPITCECSKPCGPNGYCDCGLKACRCHAGYSGESCQTDVCAMARCGKGGQCAAKYLGGNLSVSYNACICQRGWSGPLCYRNVCEGETCSGRGTCVALSDVDFRCECNNGLVTGKRCENSCEDFGCVKAGTPGACDSAPSSTLRGYCMKDGGCLYPKISEPLPSNMPPSCCYRNCPGSCVAPCPQAPSDCYLAGSCSNGVCSDPTKLPDGYPCNSATLGTCLNGICKAKGNGNSNGNGNGNGNGNNSNGNGNGNPTNGTNPNPRPQTSTTFKTTATLIPTATTAPTPVYVLKESWRGSNLFSQFNFKKMANDPSRGRVQYVERAVANASRLILVNARNQSQILLEPGARANSNKSPRKSVRLESKKSYGRGSLFLIDVQHIPEGCSVWPSMWLEGADWPKNGDIVFLQGVNLMMRNTVSLHSDPSQPCSFLQGQQQQLGTVTSSNCQAVINYNQGCSTLDGDPRSFGKAFNDNGGGVFALEWNDRGIKIWFFSRSEVPASLTSATRTIDTRKWRQPTAHYPFGGGNCDGAARFGPMKMMINTNVCGDWAGNVWSGSGCGSAGGSCNQFVDSMDANPDAFKEAYWSFNYIRIYQL